MKRRTPLKRTGRLPRESARVKREKAAFAGVYAEVDRRSGGRCEVVVDLARCPRAGVEHHHLAKPRRAHHTVGEVLLVCKPCHRQMDAPYEKGRLCYKGSIVVDPWEHFCFVIFYATDKFTARTLER